MTHYDILTILYYILKFDKHVLNVSIVPIDPMDIYHIVHRNNAPL